MPKADRFANLQKDSQKARKKAVAENNKLDKEAQVVAAAQRAQEEAEEAEEKEIRRQAQEKSGHTKGVKTSAASGAFSKAAVYGGDDSDQEEYDSAHVQSNGKTTDMPQKSLKEEKMARKRKQAVSQKGDFEFLEEEERSARTQRIISRLLRMLVVGYVLDAQKTKESTNGKNEKVKKKGGKKPDSGGVSSLGVSSIREKADQYGGPIMMLLLLVMLMIARVSEENFSPDRSLESEESYYDILGVPRDADVLAIRKTYKGLALSWHPDKNPECESCAEKFAKISKAYETLSSPERRKAYDSKRRPEKGLDAASSVELTAENFEFLVLRSNEVWIVQVFDPAEGTCESFHPVWEETSAHYQGIMRFGRIDVSKNRRALDFMPQRIVLMPMIWRFARGQEPEPFMPQLIEEDHGLRSFSRFLLTAFSEVKRLYKVDELRGWWEDGDKPRALVVGTQSRSQSTGIMQVQRLAHVWAEFSDFAIADRGTAEKVVGQHLPDDQGNTWAVVVRGNATAEPKSAAAQNVDDVNGVVNELVSQVASERVALLTVRNYQQLCGAGHGHQSRRYCLVLVDAPEEGPRISAVLAELEESRRTYAQELLDMAANEGGEEDSDSSEKLLIQPVRVMTRTSRWPWHPPAAGSAFSSLWAEAKKSPSFIIELETRRIAPLRSKTFADLFQQVAYDDIKFHELPEALSLIRAFPDPEVSLRREVLNLVTSLVGGLFTYLFVAVAMAVVPELSLAAAGAAFVATFSVILVVYPPACRRFLGYVYGRPSFAF
mmetsp:Transcript_79101/g.219815  ORF Transcript_79101/g.219815 Transcript_79101/m.219815 type:complete len:774 (+) Transcript_79101:55-2376(+)|eukprot:CAMPEP_0117525092 /NCGR_PEP_ID=MMETSP0784-20121206/35586_1 /TAXON_ID=39447 /ORGANISM="" /LENGTH=773 /DNA_ID=CAMNT_0005321267 /DNA_START=55 /DNA_END=2376 /DNA_ORIENTATION=-